MKSILILVLAYFMSAQAQAYQTKTYQEPHGKGLKRTRQSLRSMQEIHYFSYTAATTAIPGAVDLSPQVSLPDSQGRCGSCWSFSLSKALRSEMMMAGVDPGTLEYNFLLNNCGTGPKMWGCQGGDFPAAQSFLDERGPGLNAGNPYTQRDGGACKRLPVSATAVSYMMLGDRQVGPTFKDMAYAMGVGHHMVSIDVAAGAGDWENYSGGVYDGCSAGNIDHMIDAVGYSCETSVDESGNCVFDAQGKPLHRDGYLLVQNNWGENWGVKAANGHGGYMKTRMYDSSGNKCNSVASDALIFEIKQVVPSPTPTPSVTPEPPVQKCSGFLCSLFNCHLPWCSLH